MKEILQLACWILGVLTAQLWGYGEYEVRSNHIMNEVLVEVKTDGTVHIDCRAVMKAINED